MPAYHVRESDLRTCPRLKVPAMYTLLRVGLVDLDKYQWSGHIYDVSLSGMRFELDGALEPGTRVSVRGMLPGGSYTSFRAIGRVIRLHSDADDLGPATMGLTFESFNSPMDYERLAVYLATRGATTAVNRAA
ncbi:MAG: PilZ domain-containing protein [Planctomycetota bacterium]